MKPFFAQNELYHGFGLCTVVVAPLSIFFVDFLCFGFRPSLSQFLCFITVFMIICVSLRCFTEEVEDPTRTEHVCTLELFRMRVRFLVNKRG